MPNSLLTLQELQTAYHGMVEEVTQFTVRLNSLQQRLTEALNAPTPQASLGTFLPLEVLQVEDKFKVLPALLPGAPAAQCLSLKNALEACRADLLIKHKENKQAIRHNESIIGLARQLLWQTGAPKYVAFHGLMDDLHLFLDDGYGQAIKLLDTFEGHLLDIEAAQAGPEKGALDEYSGSDTMPSVSEEKTTDCIAPITANPPCLGIQNNLTQRAAPPPVAPKVQPPEAVAMPTLPAVRDSQSIRRPPAHNQRKSLPVLPDHSPFSGERKEPYLRQDATTQAPVPTAHVEKVATPRSSSVFRNARDKAAVVPGAVAIPHKAPPSGTPPSREAAIEVAPAIKKEQETLHRLARLYGASAKTPAAILQAINAQYPLARISVLVKLCTKGHLQFLPQLNSAVNDFVPVTAKERGIVEELTLLAEDAIHDSQAFERLAFPVSMLTRDMSNAVVSALEELLPLIVNSTESL